MPNDKSIFVRTRGANCSVHNFHLPGPFNNDTQYTYQIIANQGNVYFNPNVGVTEPMFIQNYSFAGEEFDGIVDGAYFKAGIYLQRSCAKPPLSENCTYGTGGDDLTIVDFKDLARYSCPFNLRHDHSSIDVGEGNTEIPMSTYFENGDEDGCAVTSGDAFSLVTSEDTSVAFSNPAVSINNAGGRLGDATLVVNEDAYHGEHIHFKVKYVT